MLLYRTHVNIQEGGESLEKEFAFNNVCIIQMKNTFNRFKLTNTCRNSNMEESVGRYGLSVTLHPSSLPTLKTASHKD